MLFRWLAICLCACAAGAPGPGVDVARALGHIDALVALGPHPGDTAESQAAASYIEAQLQTFGVKAERAAVGTVELPPVELMGMALRKSYTRVSTDPNLVVRFGPPGRALLIMAHYDTVKTSPGAIDNSAAVAVLIELARVLAARPPPSPVLIAFTANEETGLVGAEALAAQRGDQVAFAIALDLIGGTGDLSINGASRLIGAAELGWLADAADRAGVVLRAPLAHRVVSRMWPQAERSDHGPFTRRGIAALHFYHRGHDGETIDLAYHSMRDVPARVARDAVDEIGRLLRAATEVAPPDETATTPGGDTLARGDAQNGDSAGSAGRIASRREPTSAWRDAFWLPLARNVVVPRWLLIAVEIALAALALGVLIVLRSPRARGGLGAIAGAACYAVASVAVVIVERLTAGAHRAPWLHAPWPAIAAELVMLLGALALITRGVRRFAPWVGGTRYLAIAIAAPLAIGLGTLLLGAAELAWIWLVPAAAFALAPWLGGLGTLLAFALGLLPGFLVLAQVREAAWNGFLPLGMPLGGWVAGFALSPIAAFAWWLRRRNTVGPLGTLVLSVGATLALIAGVLLLLQAHPRCSAAQFQSFHLACEAAPEVR